MFDEIHKYAIGRDETSDAIVKKFKEYLKILNQEREQLK